jgi:hypothetical protein
MPGQIGANPGEKMGLGGANPYFPLDVSIPGYQANESPLWLIATAFISMISITIGASVALAKSANPTLRRADALAICWFVMCKVSTPASH